MSSMHPAASVVYVPFHQTQLTALRDGERVLVPLVPVCDALGLNTNGQVQRLRRATWACITHAQVQLPDDAQRREVACLDLDALPMWLATIDTGRVRENARPKLVLYQREAAKVLREHFFPRQAPAAEPAPALPSAEFERDLPRLEPSPFWRALSLDLFGAMNNMRYHLDGEPAGEARGEAFDTFQILSAVFVAMRTAREGARVRALLIELLERQTYGVPAR